jgi:2-iminobutanoate/2-iminopropanoate deaminase
MERVQVRMDKLDAALEKRAIPTSTVTRGGGLVFVSALPPLDWRTGEIVLGDIETQTRQCLECLKETLRTAGSCLDKVLKTTVYVTDHRYFQEVNGIYSAYFKPPFPARTFLTVGAWPFDFNIELEAVALE